MIKLIDFTGKIIVPGDIVITIWNNRLFDATVVKVCKKMLGLKLKGYRGNSLTYRYPKEVVVRTNELNLL